MSPRHDLRSAQEAELAAKLLEESAVKKAMDAVDPDEVRGLRRHLLATSLRLSPAIAPDVWAVVEESRKTLGVETPVEVYVYASAELNAQCWRPEHGRVFITFSSSLIEAFEPDELRFVAGHELGHHLFEHTRLPVKTLLDGGNLGPEPTLRLFAWQRYAEVSADRAGIVCAGGLDAAARSLFKLSSGLTALAGGRIRFDVGQFLAQAGELADEHESVESEWFTTHPFSPLRVRAAQLFAGSELFAAGGSPRAELEGAVTDLMTVMEPGYLKEKSDAGEAMRRLFFAAGIVIAGASGDVSADEIAALEKFLGEGALPPTVNPKAVREVLPRRLDDVKELAPPRKRAQLVRDLCVIALADGNADAAEEKELLAIATALGVDPTLVTRTLAGAHRLD